MTNSPNSLDNQMKPPASNWVERITAGIAVLALLGGIGGVWLKGNNTAVEHSARIYNLEQRMNDLGSVREDITELKTDMRQMKSYASENLEVQKSLAASVNELAIQVGKLQERTSR